ncbi:MAG TPA: HAMP domain-containing sensor histidine kinase [Candidatus Sulfotelmatobacter sp.]|nr:HAMP domain-containing sensor histidine kinase [Candidatus Sulfotelmatobacter sp.]
MTPRRWRGIGLQVAVVVLATTAVSLAIVAVGVVAVGRDTFMALMADHGVSTTAANDMFDRSVSVVIVGALVVAAIAAVTLSVVMAGRLTAPLRNVTAAARRIADGDYAARVEVGGPAEVASLAGSFNEMATQLQAQEQLRRDFVTNASHELRTPLTNLRGYLEALRDGVVEADAATFESLLEEVDRLVRLSRSLDTLADGGVAGPGAPEPAEIDLAAAVRTAVDLARPGLERAGVRVELTAPAVLRAHGAPDAVAQVMGNLLQNAARYTPTGGQVEVGVEVVPGYARVRVSNTGDGIPAADLPHVFERFYRVDKSRDRASGGAGIGLAIVQRLVEAGGGQVGAESAAGWTRFWFTLPA